MSSFPSGNLDRNGVLPEAETSAVSARSRKAEMPMEADSSASHEGIRGRVCLRPAPPAQAGSEITEKGRFRTGTSSAAARARMPNV